MIVFVLSLTFLSSSSASAVAEGVGETFSTVGLESDMMSCSNFCSAELLSAATMAQDAACVY